MNTLKSAQSNRPATWEGQHSVQRSLQTTWIQHHDALSFLFVFFAAMVTAIVASKFHSNASYSSYVNHGCVARPVDHVPCGILDEDLQSENFIFTGLLIVLSVLPILVGAFVGAPLLSKELESGTFRFSWTQGIGRVRYFLTTFAVFSGFLLLIAVTIGLLFGNWYAHPFEVAGATSHWQAGLFETTSWLLTAWSLFALACGCFVGAVFRRTVAAIAASTLVVGGVLVAAFRTLPRFLEFFSLSSSKYLPSGIGNQLERGVGWVVGSYMTGPNKQVISGIAALRVLDRAHSAKLGASRWLTSHGYTFWTSYQPSSHFWLLQGIEGLVVLSIAALLVWGTVRRISR